MSESHSREELIREADEARAHLASSIERLGSRQAFGALRIPLLPNLRHVALFGGFFLLLVVAGAVVSTLQRKTSAHLRRDRWRLAKQVWRHPDRMIRAERTPFLREAATRLARAVLIFSASSIAAMLRRSLDKRESQLSAGTDRVR